MKWTFSSKYATKSHENFADRKHSLCDTTDLRKKRLSCRHAKKALSENELIEVLPHYDGLGIRSKTHITQKVLEASQESLKVIGAFCIGTNQIDLEQAQSHGVIVFNAPYNNTRSVSEVVIAQLISLSRRLGDYNMKTHQKKWDKTSKDSHEIRNKVLGIVGYGHIGSQVSILAESLGLKVIFYDIQKKLPLGRSESTNSLKELLEVSDFVTLHVPEDKSTKHMINTETLSFMKKGSYLLNNSRGSVVKLDDLPAFLETKHLQGVALDVYEKEPSSNQEQFDCILQGYENVILTPHIAGSTEEAQESIGREMADNFIQFLKTGTSLGAVNFPELKAPEKKGVRILNLHKNISGVLGEINNIISEAGLNILSQSLETDSQVGYLILDLECESLDTKVVEKIKNLKPSLKTYCLKKD